MSLYDVRKSPEKGDKVPSFFFSSNLRRLTLAGDIPISITLLRQIEERERVSCGEREKKKKVGSVLSLSLSLPRVWWEYYLAVMERARDFKTPTFSLCQNAIKNPSVTQFLKRERDFGICNECEEAKKKH